MREKYFDFMRDLEGYSYLEYYITYLISPVLSGVKPSSLICLGNDNKELLNHWEDKGQKLLASLSLKSYKVDRQNLKKLQGYY